MKCVICIILNATDLSIIHLVITNSFSTEVILHSKNRVGHLKDEKGRTQKKLHKQKISLIFADILSNQADRQWNNLE